MANRHDLVTRKAYKYMLKLHFFDVDQRTEIVRYGERITRSSDKEVIESEFLKHKNEKPYILTQVEILEKYENLYTMEPAVFYQNAELAESKVIK